MGNNHLIEYEIEHVRQPTLDTCATACMAMVTGLRVSAIQQEFHEAFMVGSINIPGYLKGKGFDARPAYSHQRITDFGDLPAVGDKVTDAGNLLVLAVPSLVSMRFLHEIILDMRDGRVYDPLKGWEGKPYYGQQEDGSVVQVMAHVVDCHVVVA